jgi:hypothetical protein
MAKKFKLSAAQMQPLAPRRGACIATDYITVDGYKVDFMKRDTPRNPADSGWQFLSGRETQEYMNIAVNSGIYDVNTIANCDPDIVPYVDAPIGCAFERRGASGAFVQIKGPAWTPAPTSPLRGRGHWPPPGYPLVEGRYALTSAWSIALPSKFARRVEDGSLVLWQPGLTLWMIAWGNDQGTTQAARLAYFKNKASASGYAHREMSDGALLRFDYRLRDHSSNGIVESLNALVFADQGHLQLSIYFDAVATELQARELCDSVRYTAK